MSHPRMRAGTLLLAVTTISGVTLPLVAGPAGAAVPAAPTSLTVTRPPGAAPGKEQRLEWSPVAGATGYDVQVSASADWSDGASIVIPAAHTTAPVYVPPPDLPHATYYWRVRADASGGAGSWTDAGGFVRAWNEQPTGLTAQGADGPQLSWTPIRDASFYEVEISDSPSFPDAALVQGSNGTIRCFTNHTTWNAYADVVGKEALPDCLPSASFTLDRGTTYYWRVRGRDGTAAKAGKYATAGDAQCTGVWHSTPVDNVPATPECSLWSADVSFTVPEVTSAGSAAALASPTGLAASCDHDCQDTPVLSWSPATGAELYRVSIARDKAMTNITHVFDVYDTSLWQGSSGPDEQQTLYWTVQACVTGAPTEVNTDSSATKPTCGPAAAAAAYPTKRSNPVTLSGVAYRSKYPTLSWAYYYGSGGRSEARDYELQVATTPDFTALVDDERTDLPTYTAQKSYPDTTLWWRVRATDQSGNALPWSTPRSFVSPLVIAVDSGSALMHQAWAVAASGSSSGGAYAYSSSAGDRITFTFSGSTARLLGTRGASGGYADVYVDGVRRGTANFYAPTTRYRQVVFAATLSGGSHVLSAVIRGSHPAGSRGNVVAVDALTVAAGTLQEGSAIQRWSTHRATDAAGGSYLAESGFAAANVVRQPQAWTHLYGASVAVYGCKSPASGRMAVWIDGHFVATVDLYQSYSSCNRAVFRSGLLQLGTHTVVVRALGTARSGSHGTRVSVDRLIAG